MQFLERNKDHKFFLYYASPSAAFALAGTTKMGEFLYRQKLGLKTHIWVIQVITPIERLGPLMQP